MLTVEDELKPIEISATLNADEAETSTYCINLRHYHVEPQTRLLNVLSRSADGRLRLLTSRHEYVTPRFVNLYVQVETMATELIYQTEMSWIGVERIEVRAGACDKSYDCTFEPGEPCGWRSVLPITAMPDSLFEFKIRTCESMSEDVTTDRPDGHALISSNGMSEAEFKKNGYANGTAVAIFRSPSIKGGVDQHRCFTFYQYVKSLQHARLDLRPYFVNRHLTGEPIWSNVHSVQVDSLYQWQKVQLSLLFTSDMHLEFVAYNLPGSEVALDEISLRDGPCEPTPTCSFQNYDFCSYRSDDTNENRFLILHELPPNRKPKMSTEMAKHVRQLVKESQPFALFDVTMLSRLKTDFYYEAGVVSPLFSRQSSTCLRVEYSFMADDVSDSYFSIEFKQYRTFVTLLRDDEPQQFSGDWNQAEFTIPPGHNMKIKFLAAVHYSNESSVPMVAIKSVQSFKGDCESTVDSEPVEEFTCSFDDNACAYLYSSGSDLSWTRYDGSKPHPDLPNFDGNDGEHTDLAI